MSAKRRTEALVSGIPQAAATAFATYQQAFGAVSFTEEEAHRSYPLHPLTEVLMRYHLQLKAQLDPQRIFNPGRMYAEL